MRLYNFRDIGGIKTKCARETKRGLLFRTANVTHLTEEEAAKLVDKYSIETYIDFRGLKEVKGIGEPSALMGKNVNWVNLTVSAEDPDFERVHKPDVKDWIRLYHRLFEKNMPVWEKFIDIVGGSEAPVAYGCLFGKDRTGIATSLLLDLLNVDDESIAANYSETTEHIMPVFEQFRFMWKELPLSEAEIHKHYLRAHPEVIRGFLDYLREHPEETHVGAFLRMISKTKKEALQEKLLIKV